jgi:hypothetical protein
MEPRMVDVCEYVVSEVGQLRGERGFQFDRMDLDRPERWHVRVVGNWMECDCPSGAYRGDCKHAAAVRQILEQEQYHEKSERTARD